MVRGVSLNICRAVRFILFYGRKATYESKDNIYKIEKAPRCKDDDAMPYFYI
jgi:hypothetical protein